MRRVYAAVGIVCLVVPAIVAAGYLRPWEWDVARRLEATRGDLAVQVGMHDDYNSLGVGELKQRLAKAERAGRVVRCNAAQAAVARDLQRDFLPAPRPCAGDACRGLGGRPPDARCRAGRFGKRSDAGFPHRPENNGRKSGDRAVRVALLRDGFVSIRVARGERDPARPSRERRVARGRGAPVVA